MEPCLCATLSNGSVKHPTAFVACFVVLCTTACASVRSCTADVCTSDYLFGLFLFVPPTDTNQGTGAMGLPDRAQPRLVDLERHFKCRKKELLKNGSSHKQRMNLTLSDQLLFLQWLQITAQEWFVGIEKPVTRTPFHLPGSSKVIDDAGLDSWEFALVSCASHGLPDHCMRVRRLPEKAMTDLELRESSSRVKAKKNYFEGKQMSREEKAVMHPVKCNPYEKTTVVIPIPPRKKRRGQTTGTREHAAGDEDEDGVERRESNRDPKRSCQDKQTARIGGAARGSGAEGGSEASAGHVASGGEGDVVSERGAKTQEPVSKRSKKRKRRGEMAKDHGSASGANAQELQANANAGSGEGPTDNVAVNLGSAHGATAKTVGAKASASASKGGAASASRKARKANAPADDATPADSSLKRPPGPVPNASSEDEHGQRQQERRKRPKSDGGVARRKRRLEAEREHESASSEEEQGQAARRKRPKRRVPRVAYKDKEGWAGHEGSMYDPDKWGVEAWRMPRTGAVGRIAGRGTGPEFYTERTSTFMPTLIQRRYPACTRCKAHAKKCSSSCIPGADDERPCERC